MRYYSGRGAREDLRYFFLPAGDLSKADLSPVLDASVAAKDACSLENSSNPERKR
jgi:hypothetical protein